MKPQTRSDVDVGGDISIVPVVQFWISRHTRLDVKEGGSASYSEPDKQIEAFRHAVSSFAENPTYWSRLHILQESSSSMERKGLYPTEPGDETVVLE